MWRLGGHIRGTVGQYRNSLLDKVDYTHMGTWVQVFAKVFPISSGQKILKECYKGCIASKTNNL